MDRWLDSLSEDWISQPRSDHSGSVVKDGYSPTSSASQSRIPRYKPRSTSNISNESKAVLGKSKPRKTSLNETALKEKTSSNLNSSQHRVPNGQTKPQSLNAASMRLRNRHDSSDLSHPGLLGTVQYKSSPVKERGPQATPEWKRRVLKENGGGNLFSPIGLESVFNPPTAKTFNRGQPAGKRKLIPQDIVSPSPPPLPLIAQQEHAASGPYFQKPVPASVSQYSADGRGRCPEDDAVRGPLAPSSERATRKETDGIVSQFRSPDHVAGGLVSGASPAAQVRSLSGSDRSSVQRSAEREEVTGVSSTNDKSRNEDISPFFVSRRNTVDGGVEYAAVDKSMERLRSEMDKLRSQQQNIPSSRSSDHGIDYTESRLSERPLSLGQMDEVTSQSLPDDLSMGTDAYVANGGFVSTHRGGYSNDGSFQRRPVSPSLLPDMDGPSLESRLSTGLEVMGSPAPPEHFSQTKSKTPSSPPHTPKNDSYGNSDSYERPKSSGSPLKLFENYDTFTNDRLARRISKFERTLTQELDEESIQVPSSPSPRRRRRYTQSQEEPPANTPNPRRISSFGDGQLEGHDFAMRPVSESNIWCVQVEQGIEFRSSSRQRSTGPQSRSSVYCHPSGSDLTRDKKSKERTKYAGKSPGQRAEEGTIRGESRAINSRKHELQATHDHQEALRTSTGKRLPYSPAKDPAPKRRRTLQASADLDHGSVNSPHVEVEEKSTKHVHGRKRKDALYDNDRQVADPSTIAMRQILQPRLPGPIQPGSSIKTRLHDRGREPSGSEEGQDLNPAADSNTQIVAGALATVALNTVQDMTCGSRKASVTTADFFNEAQHIMQLIRAKGRPRSSHNTAEASEVERTTIAEESVMEDSTKDEFSRPPSREGSGPSRQIEPLQMDARVVSQLRKFEDEDDLGLALSSSLKVLQIHESLAAPEPLVDNDVDNDNPHSSTECDPPNIRIRQGLAESHSDRDISSSKAPSSAGTEVRHHSQESQPTSAPSSNRSNPTGSSEGSTKRMVIAPETVAHLLSDQMAGMVFDRQKQLWVKRKSSPNAGGMESLDRSASEETEEDLFGGIPDLSVDEMKELQTVKDVVSSMRLMGSMVDKISTHDHLTSAEQQNRVFSTRNVNGEARPHTADGKLIEPIETSSAPSKYSHFASSGPGPGTRATSWGDEVEVIKDPQLPIHVHSRTSATLKNEPAEEVEHEISILDGRGSCAPRPQNKHRQARVVTVAFSSPLVDQREYTYEQDNGSQVEEEISDLKLYESPAAPGSYQKPSPNRRASFGGPLRSSQRRASRRASTSNQSYMARPMSRLDEHDEMSLVQCTTGNRHMTLEVAISTPLPLSRSLILPPPTTDQRSSVGFHLSPLSEFTVHQVDKPIDLTLNQIAKRRGSRVQEPDTKLSLAADDLLKKLTDLEPYEPYWDYLRSLDLHDRNLKTLHMLEEFCGQLEELDVSNNQIGELDGIPHNVRLLNIRGNCLSDLAAWKSLQNLQYLDVSGNHLKSMKGFQSLIHLRALKAEYNEMETLSGLEDLDGLTSLSLRGNRLRSVDFEKFNL